MYEGFSDAAKKVYQLAHQEAHHLNHLALGVEHLLLGLAKEDEGIAGKMIRDLRVDVPQIRAQVEQLSPPGPDHISAGRLPETEEAAAVRQRAIESAQRLQHSQIGTGHLLLALLQKSETEHTACQTLANLGADLDGLREEALLRLEDEDAVEEVTELKPDRGPLRPAHASGRPATEEELALMQEAAELVGHEQSVLRDELPVARHAHSTEAFDFDAQFGDDPEIRAALLALEGAGPPQPLTDDQRRQAVQLANYLHARIDKIYKSPLTRSKDQITLGTAQWQDLLQLMMQVAEYLDVLDKQVPV